MSGGGGGATLAALLFAVAGVSVVGAQVFGPPLAVNSDAATDSAWDVAPCFASDGPGRWVAVWEAPGRFGFDHDIIVSRSTDGGAMWTPPAALNTDAATDGQYDDDRRPRIATDGSTFVTVWTSSFLGVRVATSHDGGTTWSVPISIDPIPHSPSIAFADVATDGAGTWVAVWEVASPGGEEAVWAARSTDGGGTWSAAVVISGTPAADIFLDGTTRIASDGAAWVAVWGQEQFAQQQTEALVFARSLDGGATWSTPTALSPPGSEQGIHAVPAVAGGPGGRWIVVWMSTDSLGGTTTKDMHIFTSRSGDGGETWSFPVVLDPLVEGGAGPDNQPSIATDGAGRWVAAWIGNLWVARTASSVDGGASWTSPTTVSPGSAFAPNVATDGRGTWVLGWDTFTPTFDYDIFVARGAICGDGLVGIGEECDHGDATGQPGDCCTATCQYQPAGLACANAGDLCALDVCNATGTCTHSIAPSPVCAAPSVSKGASLVLQAIVPGQDRAQFKWEKGPVVPLTDFGNPMGGEFIRLCVYDETGPGSYALALRGSPSVSSGGRWTGTPTGWKFKSTTGAPDGITGVTLKAGMVALKAKVQVKARNPAFPAGLPLQENPSIVAQFKTSLGTCWGATFSTPTVNTTTEFRAKSD